MEVGIGEIWKLEVLAWQPSGRGASLISERFTSIILPKQDGCSWFYQHPGTALRLNELGSGDYSPVPRVSSVVLLDLWLQPGQCPLVDTKDGAPGGGGSRSETETVIKSFFILPHPQQEVILSSQQGEGKSKRLPLTLWPSSDWQGWGLSAP